jgi:hypothetical protein
MKQKVMIPSFKRQTPEPLNYKLNTEFQSKISGTHSVTGGGSLAEGSVIGLNFFWLMKMESLKKKFLIKLIKLFFILVLI